MEDILLRKEKLWLVQKKNIDYSKHKMNLKKKQVNKYFAFVWTGFEWVILDGKKDRLRMKFIFLNTWFIFHQ